MTAHRIRRICLTVLVAANVNWLVFGGLSTWIGGVGWHGYVEGDRYYVGLRGVYTEVYRATFVFTKIHFVVSLLLLPVGLIAGLIQSLIGEHEGTQ